MATAFLSDSSNIFNKRNRQAFLILVRGYSSKEILLDILEENGLTHIELPDVSSHNVQDGTEESFNFIVKIKLLENTFVDRSTTTVNSKHAHPDTSRETRTLYSPFGFEMFIVAQSHTAYELDHSMVDPLISYSNKRSIDSKYDLFGGTSFSTPVIAGTIALIIG